MLSLPVALRFPSSLTLLQGCVSDHAVSVAKCALILLALHVHILDVSKNLLQRLSQSPDPLFKLLDLSIVLCFWNV